MSFSREMGCTPAKGEGSRLEGMWRKPGVSGGDDVATEALEEMGAEMLGDSGTMKPGQSMDQLIDDAPVVDLGSVWNKA